MYNKNMEIKKIYIDNYKPILHYSDCRFYLKYESESRFEHIILRFYRSGYMRIEVNGGGKSSIGFMDYIQKNIKEIMEEIIKRIKENDAVFHGDNAKEEMLELLRRKRMFFLFYMLSNERVYKTDEVVFCEFNTNI
jgi:hypothetical protein